MHVTYCTYMYGIYTAILYLTTTCLCEETCMIGEPGNGVFKAQCNNTQVILMSKAIFGRKQVGECITGDAGDIGCYADVLPYMDRRCSGMQQCSVPVAPLDAVAHGCSKDAFKYLDTQHDCVSAQTIPSCDDVAIAKRGDTEGFVASRFLHLTGEGSRRCPWQVTAQQGQHIDLHLYNFLLNDFIVQQMGIQSDKPCPVNVSVEEADGTLNAASLCQTGLLRPLPLYSSATNYIKFWIAYNGTLRNNATFMIKYSVMGCPDMDPIESAQMVRQMDMMTVRCNNTQETWYLLCKGTQWQGEIGNCSYKKPIATTPVPNTEDPDPSVESIIIAVVIGLVVGVIVGLGMLGLVVLIKNCCEDRNKKKEADPHRNPQAALADLSNIDVPYPTVRKPQLLREGAQTVPRPGSSSQSQGSEPFYHTYDSRTLPTLPRGNTRPYPYLERGVSADDSAIGTEASNMKPGTISTSSSFETVRSEHVYETAYAMQQLHKQYMETMRRQHGDNGFAPAIPEELTAAQIVAIHQAAKDMPKTSQPSDVQAEIH